MFPRRVSQWLSKLPSPQRETWTVRAFGLTKVPVLGFLWPTVMKIDQNSSVIRLRLGYRSRNHVKSMYFGALCAGADLSAGTLAVKHITDSDRPIGFLFKDINGEFLKRAESDVHFHCNDGKEIYQAVLAAETTGVRQNIPVSVSAKDVSGQEVARFQLTLSMKTEALRL